ncbi:MAG: hypothetical protein CL878_08945 [Dehalococcoidia bacterium]|nr:hypothetical protein [Dehalococcoidia bacterium]
MAEQSGRRRGPLEQLREVMKRVQTLGTYPTEGWGLWSPDLSEWFNPGGDRPYHHTRAEAEQFLERARMHYPTGDWRLMRVSLDESGAPAGPPEEVESSASDDEE